MNRLNRRDFIRVGTGSAAGALLTQAGCVSSRRAVSARKRVAFNTANLVARFTGYRFELKNWGDQHQKTVALIDESAWRAISRDIAATGFPAVEIWEAHAAPESLNR